MYFVYILQSLKDKTYYIGHAADLIVRLKRHNKGRVRLTRNKSPWRLIYKEEYITKQEAYRRELQIKSYKSGEAFKKLIKKIKKD